MTKENYVIVRTKSAGVFFGRIKELDRNYRIITLTEARRLWHWSGAASLSQLAIEGVKNPDKCKFSVETEDHMLFEVIETIPCTPEAIKSIKEVKSWKV